MRQAPIKVPREQFVVAQDPKTNREAIPGMSDPRSIPQEEVMNLNALKRRPYAKYAHKAIDADRSGLGDR